MMDTIPTEKNNSNLKRSIANMIKKWLSQKMTVIYPGGKKQNKLTGSNINVKMK